MLQFGVELLTRIITSSKHEMALWCVGFHRVQFRLRWKGSGISSLRQWGYDKLHPDTCERLPPEGLWFPIQI